MAVLRVQSMQLITYSLTMISVHHITTLDNFSIQMQGHLIMCKCMGLLCYKTIQEQLYSTQIPSMIIYLTKVSFKYRKSQGPSLSKGILLPQTQHS